MRHTWRTALLATAALTVGATSALAQPANCRDVDNNGSVSAADAAQLLRRLGSPLTPICGGAGIACADINANGAIDSGDLLLLSASLAGNESCYVPCTGPAAVTCPATVSGTIATNQHWGPAGCVVDLDGLVTVAAPATLTIDPGVVVRGIKNLANPAALVIARGAKIDANGNNVSPIVLTSNQTPGTRGPGDWGGLTINGSAPVNFVGGEGSSEGLPPGSALYGGTDVADNSCRVRFTRIEFSGIEFTTDNELNVFTMNGVGRGTEIDHVQAHRGNDDGHEWFGGNVNTRFLVSTANRDDDLDHQIGFRGTVQFALSQKCAPALTDGSGRHGIEGDNIEFTPPGFDGQPRSWPFFCNVTSIGAFGGSAITGSGANLRRGSAGIVANSIFTDWRSECLDIDNDATIARGCVNSATLQGPPDNLLVQNSTCYNNDFADGGDDQITGSTVTPNCTPDQLYDLWETQGLKPDQASIGADPGIAARTGVGACPTNPVNPADYVPSAPVAAPSCALVDDVDGARSNVFLPGTLPIASNFEGAFAAGFDWLDDAPVCNVNQVGGCWISFDLS